MSASGTLLALLLLAFGPACATAQQLDPAELFREHVAWLADDARSGRQTGSPGLAEAADYIARAFADAGLQPGGDEGFLQRFDARGARMLVGGDERNRLLVGGQPLALGSDWTPFASAASAGVSGPLVFAGYGIVDEEFGYDDYAGLDVQDKVVVVLRQAPGASQRAAAGQVAVEPIEQEVAAQQRPGSAPGEGLVATAASDEGHAPSSGDPGARWLDPAGRGRHHAAFATKINTAFQRGAAALLVVNDPASCPPGSGDDVLVPYGAGGMAGVAASLPAAHLTAAAGVRVLAALGLDLAVVQRGLDETLQGRSFAIPGGEASLAIETEHEVVSTVNVVGLLPGNDPARSDEYVVIGAHMDHLGLGDRSGSLGGADAVGQVHNGADDNASGIAGLIEAARRLRQGPPLPRSVMFVAFGAEEWGLLGSRRFVEHAPRPLQDCVAMVNMDMIGRSGGQVIVNGIGTARDGVLDRLLRDAEDELALPIEVRPAPGVPGNSDHAPFFEKGIPVLSFFTGLHDDYHRPSDDVERVDATAGAHIASLAAWCTAGLARLSERPAFVDPGAEKDAALAQAVAHAAPSHGDGGEQPVVVGYGVVLGSIPDMTYQQDDGVRLSGVRAGTPGAKAGLAEGDFIVSLDGKPVRNLEDYSVLLFSHRPGDEIVLGVRRGGEVLELRAVLEGRGGDA